MTDLDAVFWICRQADRGFDPGPHDPEQAFRAIQVGLDVICDHACHILERVVGIACGEHPALAPDLDPLFAEAEAHLRLRHRAPALDAMIQILGRIVDVPPVHHYPRGHLIALAQVTASVALGPAIH